MTQLTNLTQEKFTELSNLINAICNTHNAKIKIACGYDDFYCIDVETESLDAIVDMNFELAEKITSNKILENLDFIVKFEPYQTRLKIGENEMSLSQELDKLILRYGFVAVSNFLKSKDEPITVLDGDTVIKGVSLVKPMTGDIIAIRDGKPVRK